MTIKTANLAVDNSACHVVCAAPDQPTNRVVTNKNHFQEFTYTKKNHRLFFSLYQKNDFVFLGCTKKTDLFFYVVPKKPIGFLRGTKKNRFEDFHVQKNPICPFQVQKNNLSISGTKKTDLSNFMYQKKLIWCFTLYQKKTDALA